MRVCFFIADYPSEDLEPSSYLDRFALHRVLPKELVHRGHDVHVIQLFNKHTSVTIDGVHYHFVSGPPLARGAAALAAAALKRSSHHFVPMSGLEAIPSPDVVHFHGTQLHLNLSLLRRRLKTAALVLHYHGGYPPRQRIGRALQRLNFEAADALLFTSAVQAGPFLEAGILRDRSKIYELMETSSSFGSKRERVEFSGHPVFVSACRLHPIKDPLTTLKGFELSLEAYPDAELYHFYRTDELLAELQSYVAARPQLRRRVHFCGTRAYEDMEAVFNGADVLLQSSLREFSGCAVLDAMACGVIPVLSDIPAFRKMTNDGRAGLLFEPGNPAALAARVRGLMDIPAQKLEVGAFFERELSFSAMAARIEAIYGNVLELRRD